MSRFSHLKLTELKSLCKKYKLPVSGTKSVLINRLSSSKVSPSISMITEIDTKPFSLSTILQYQEDEKKSSPKKSSPEKSSTRRKRNHSMCNNGEKSVSEYFSNNIGNTFLVNNKNYEILKIIGKKDKSDVIVLVKDIETQKDKKIGIQVKLKNATFVENWIKPQKLVDKIYNMESFSKKEKKEALNEILNLENLIEKDIEIFQSYLKKYRKTKSRSKFVKLGMCVSFTKSKNYLIQSELLKTLFIRGIDNNIDEFYYIKLDTKTGFCHSNLEFVDKNYISNMELYFHPRMIYSSSGKTQLGHPDFFDTNTEIDGKKFTLNLPKMINY